MNYLIETERGLKNKRIFKVLVYTIVRDITGY